MENCIYSLDDLRHNLDPGYIDFTRRSYVSQFDNDFEKRLQLALQRNYYEKDSKSETRPSFSRSESFISIATDAETIPERDQATWRYPRSNMFRLGAAFMGFFVGGLKDSATGVVLPQIEQYYHISYFTVSLAFLAPFFGSLLAASINDKVHRVVGRLGVVIFGACLQLSYFITASIAPPFPLFVLSYSAAGLGSGIIEGSWNAFGGTLKNSNQILGLLHGFYGIGGVVSPSVGQLMIGKGLPWNRVYLLLVGCSAVSLVCSSIAFRHDRSAKYMKEISNNDGSKNKNSFLTVIKSKLVWILAFTIFLYVGGEVSTGGWTTTYMIEVRNGDSDKMGYVSTGYWIGIALGRIVLGFVSAKIGHLQVLIVVYLVGVISAALCFWLIPNIIAAAVSIGVVGLLVGPLFPTMVAVSVTKLPKWLHVSGLGFAAAFGGGGAAVIPFVAGALSDTFGPWAIAPLIVGAFSGNLLLWLVIMKFF
jgi:fucose permease